MGTQIYPVDGTPLRGRLDRRAVGDRPLGVVGSAGEVRAAYCLLPTPLGAHVGILVFIVKRSLITVPVLFGMSIVGVQLDPSGAGGSGAGHAGVDRDAGEHRDHPRQQLGSQRSALAAVPDLALGCPPRRSRHRLPLARAADARCSLSRLAGDAGADVAGRPSVSIADRGAARGPRGGREGRGRPMSPAPPLSLVGISVPDFWLGVLLILLVSLRARLAAAVGLPADARRGCRQPALHGVARVDPGDLDGGGADADDHGRRCWKCSSQDYIKFTRAKGMRERLVVYKHALRNASIPIVTVLGLQFGYLLGGAVIVESIFSLPGIGRMTLNAVNTRSYPIVQGGVLIIGLIFMLVNLVTDLLYAVLNPRIRMSSADRDRRSGRGQRPPTALQEADASRSAGGHQALSGPQRRVRDRSRPDPAGAGGAVAGAGPAECDQCERGAGGDEPRTIPSGRTISGATSSAAFSTATGSRSRSPSRRPPRRWSSGCRSGWSRVTRVVGSTTSSCGCSTSSSPSRRCCWRSP